MHDRTEVRARFTRLASLEDASLDVVEGALWIAAEEDLALDVGAVRRRIDELGDRLGRSLAGAEDFFHAVWAINHLLYGELGLRGDTDAYDDPDNSYLHRVLERRRGIPISLGILYAAVARRVGYHVDHVGVPGHLVLCFEDDWGRTHVDPFHRGEVVTRDDLQALLAQRYGARARLSEEHLRPLSAREVLSRLLRNLKRVYVRRSDFARALLASERIVLLNPGVHDERRDRGLLYRKTGRREAAIADLRDYLVDRPDAADAPRIRRLLADLLHKRSAEG